MSVYPIGDPEALDRKADELYQQWQDTRGEAARARRLIKRKDFFDAVDALHQLTSSADHYSEGFVWEECVKHFNEVKEAWERWQAQRGMA